MYFFSSQVDKVEVDRTIERAKALAAELDTPSKELFMSRLLSRISDFESELLSGEPSQAEKEQILAQYNRFAKALIHCMTRPQFASNSIRYYFNQRYYPVGIHDTEKPNPLVRSIAIAATATGFALLFSTIPAFIFNPAFGAILLSIAITLLLPGCFSLYIPESPNTSKKKDEERCLLQQSAQLIDPEIIFDVEPYYNYTEPALSI